MDNNVGYKKNRPIILLIALAGMTAYLLPYFRYYYYDAYLAYFGINDLQMGALGSVYGALAIVGYCLGGWVADRAPLKIVVPGSLVVTGAAGLVLLTKPAYPVHVAIYAIWGITTILTFWNPLMKVLRTLSRSEEQARGYALFDMGRGILNFGSGLLIMAAFTALCRVVGDTRGMTGLIVFYALEAIIVGVICYFALRNRLPDFTKTSKEKDTNFAREVLKALKMPTTWMLVIIMFTTYGVIISYTYVVPYCTAAFGMSAALAGIMGYAANGFRFAGCWIGGQIADRKGLSSMMLADLVLMAVGVAGLLVTPKSMKFMWMLIISIAILCMFMYSAQALHYAIMEEGNYPIETMGAATFIITPLGYGAESIMPLFNGWCLSTFDGISGYRVMFTGFLILIAIGFLACMGYRHFTKERRAELAELRKAGGSAATEAEAG